jgi:hypothetical protein
MKKKLSKGLFIVFTLLLTLIYAPQIKALTATGGNITTIIDINDGLNYTVHTFYSNETFAPTGTGTIQTLIVAGGGSGGGSAANDIAGGGGGAGGLIYNSSYYVDSDLSVIVGSGGIFAGGYVNGTSGGNSSIGTATYNLTAVGGGGGGRYYDKGLDGGSGGGSGGQLFTPGLSVSGQGYNGGNSSGDGRNAGGGGGSGGYGGNGITTSTGGMGGIGLNYSINGTVVNYSCGGGGGGHTTSGQPGCLRAGMGANGSGVPSVNASQFSGSGGGGAYYLTNLKTAGNGGSGIIIIRYLTGGGSTTATISFISPTPSNQTAQYYLNNDTIRTAVIVTNNAGLNTTIRLYHGGTLLDSVPNSTEHNFTGVSFVANNYYINAHLINPDGSINISTETRRIDIYDITTNITNPINYEKINRSLNLTFSSTATSPYVNVSSQNITLRPYSDITIINISLANLSGANTSYNYDLFTTNLTTGLWYVVLYAFDTLSNNNSDNIIINLTKDAQLNITAKYSFNNATITNFTINITDETTGETQSINTTNNKTIFEIVKNRNYTILIDAPGYAIMNVTNTSFTNLYNNYTLYIYTDNSVRITIYDEATLIILNTTTTSITFQNNVTALVYSTSNGTYYKDGLTDGLWIIKFYSANYSYRTYTITVANRSTQTLDAYLTPSAYTTIFTIRDSQTLTTLEGVSFTIERLNNATYIIVESKSSDISGAVQFGYLPGIEYRFTLTKSGYAGKVFSLNPVLFASYNIYLDRVSSLNNTLNYGLISIVYYPKTFYNDQINSLTFTISSPEGVLTNYGVNIKAPGGSNSSQGHNAIGETFTLYFNITGATLFDRVNISYNYTSTVGGTKAYYLEYEIIGTGIGGNNTISGIKNKEYGLGAFEKVLLATLALIFVAGFAYMLSGMAGAIVSGLLVMGVSVYLGFLPLWSVVISFITGIIILVATSVGGNK